MILLTRTYSISIGLCLCLLLGLSHRSYAQNSLQEQDYISLQVYKDFQKRTYESVIARLSSQEMLTANQEILLALSRIKIGAGDTTAIIKWLSTNDNHPLQPTALLYLGEYYFYEDDLERSETYLAQIKGRELSEADQWSYGYTYGRIQLTNENYQDAASLFDFASESTLDNNTKVTYYHAFTNYHLNNKKEALSGFRKTESDTEFRSSSSFFIARILLDEGKYDEVIEWSQKELSEEATVTNSGFYQLIGEAYAQKADVAKANAYFDRAIALHPDTPTPALYYQAGVAAFKLGNEEKAMQYFEASGLQGGEYAQLSAWQLGRIHLKKGDLQAARGAYTEAAESADSTIRKESVYQLSKIYAKLGDFTQTIEYATDFLETYADAEQKEELESLVAESYLRTSNYRLAIEYLQKTEINSQQRKRVFQQVTYRMGVQRFNDADFAQAKKDFLQSLTYPVLQEVTDEAYYHLAEIALMQDRYKVAIDWYQKMSRPGYRADYGIGYAHYNTYQYALAIPYFKRAANLSGELGTDANVRLADCLFATKSYEEAASRYATLNPQQNDPYLTYQEAASLKSLSKNQAAIRKFRQLTTNERYAAEATYQIGMIHLETANFANAIQSFSTVIDQHPTKSQYPRALLSRGLANKNLGQLQKARQDFQQILDSYLTHEIAIDAILGMQELQQAGVSVPNLNQYIADYKQANPDSGSLEFIEYEAAKGSYFSQAYADAIPLLQNYIASYPNSKNLPEANYLLADSYYQLQDFESAAPVFAAIKDIQNAYTGRVLNRLGEVYRTLSAPDEAIATYKQLRLLNLSEKDNYRAHRGLMEIYLDQENYREAIRQADEILAGAWRPINGEEDALLTKARSLYALNRVASARSAYQQLASNENSYGAEANFYLALIKYQSEEYDASLDQLFELNSSYGSYVEWVDRSYLLIAKNYLGKDDQFQAKATLRSIVQHASLEQVVNEAMLLLNKIERQASGGDTTTLTNDKQ